MGRVSGILFGCHLIQRSSKSMANELSHDLAGGQKLHKVPLLVPYGNLLERLLGCSLGYHAFDPFPFLFGGNPACARSKSSLAVTISVLRYLDAYEGTSS